MIGPVTVLPEALPPDGQLIIRRWLPADAAALSAAVEASREHLSPWLPWADERISDADRRQRITEWETEWANGGDVIYGVFLNEKVAGGGGLHHRLGRGGLEVGYWIARDYTGQGLATRFAKLATDAAFTVPGIDRVEIHHDEGNTASGAVPRRLGFTRVAEVAAAKRTDAEVGIEVQWRVTRDAWLAKHGSGS